MFFKCFITFALVFSLFGCHNIPPSTEQKLPEKETNENKVDLPTPSNENEEAKEDQWYKSFVKERIVAITDALKPILDEAVEHHDNSYINEITMGLEVLNNAINELQSESEVPQAYEKAHKLLLKNLTEATQNLELLLRNDKNSMEALKRNFDVFTRLSGEYS